MEKTVTYLEITPDWKLFWGPAMKVVLHRMKDHTNILRSLGGTTWGTPSQMPLQLYRGLILARPLHALPLVQLSANQLKNLEQAQCVALQIQTALSKSVLESPGRHRRGTRSQMQSWVITMQK